MNAAVKSVQISVIQAKLKNLESVKLVANINAQKQPALMDIFVKKKSVPTSIVQSVVIVVMVIWTLIGGMVCLGVGLAVA